MLSPIDEVLQALRGAGCDPRENGHPGNYQARCPAHDDNKPSLSVSTGNDGRVLIHCHAGCSTDAVCDALDLKPRDLFPQRERRPSKRGGWASVDAVVDWLKRKHHGDRITTYTYHAPNGQAVGVVFRIDHAATGGKTVLPARLTPAGNWELGAMPSPRPLYRLPDLLSAPADTTIYVVEGEKCSDVLRQIGLVATTSAGGAQAPGKSDWSALAGRRVIVLPDNDQPGVDYARKVARLIAKAGGQPRILYLKRHCPDLPEGGDIADVLTDDRWCGLPMGDAASPADFAAWLEALAAELLTGDHGDDLAESADLADLAGPTGGVAEARDKPTIAVSCEEHAVIQDMLDLLPRDGRLFSRGGVLCIEQGGKLIPLTVELLSELFTRLAVFKSRKPLDDDETAARVHPPRWAVKAILDRRHWPGVREVRGVVNWPIVNSNGEVIAGGYDPLSQVLVVGAPAVELPAHADEGDVSRAADKLLDVIWDFPFVDKADRATDRAADRAPDRAAWLAALLTGIVRYAFDGPAPLFVVEANCQGTGKTLLADVLGVILTGEPLPRMPWTRDGDEARKRITSIALRGEPLMLLDNITHTIGGSELAALLTGTKWTDRLLGSNSTLSCRVDTVWLATSNGALFDADLARRVIPIRLETELEHPEQRTEFRHPRLLEHVRQHRAELLTAALTIIHGWLIAGKPMQAGLCPLGSYEAWSDWVRAPLVWMGFSDPVLTRENIMHATPERQAVFELASWLEAHHASDDEPWPTLAELVSKARGDDHTSLREAIEVLAGALDARRLGNKLKPWLRRNVGGKRIVPLSSRGGINRYRVESIK